MQLRFCIAVRLENPTSLEIAQCSQESGFYLLRGFSEVRGRDTEIGKHSAISHAPGSHDVFIPRFQAFARDSLQETVQRGARVAQAIADPFEGNGRRRYRLDFAMCPSDCWWWIGYCPACCDATDVSCFSRHYAPR